jgi:hypothetical protein
LITSFNITVPHSGTKSQEQNSKKNKKTEQSNTILVKGYKIRQNAKKQRRFITKTGCIVFCGRTKKQAGLHRPVCQKMRKNRKYAFFVRTNKKTKKQYVSPQICQSLCLLAALVAFAHGLLGGSGPVLDICSGPGGGGPDSAQTRVWPLPWMMYL